MRDLHDAEALLKQLGLRVDRVPGDVHVTAYNGDQPQTGQTCSWHDLHAAAAQHDVQAAAVYGAIRTVALALRAR